MGGRGQIRPGEPRQAVRAALHGGPRAHGFLGTARGVFGRASRAVNGKFPCAARRADLHSATPHDAPHRLHPPRQLSAGLGSERPAHLESAGPRHPRAWQQEHRRDECLARDGEKMGAARVRLRYRERLARGAARRLAGGEFSRDRSPAPRQDRAAFSPRRLRRNRRRAGLHPRAQFSRLAALQGRQGRGHFARRDHRDDAARLAHYLRDLEPRFESHALRLARLARRGGVPAGRGHRAVFPRVDSRLGQFLFRRRRRRARHQAPHAEHPPAARRHRTALWHAEATGGCAVKLRCILKPRIARITRIFGNVSAHPFAFAVPAFNPCNPCNPWFLSPAVFCV